MGRRKSTTEQDGCAVPPVNTTTTTAVDNNGEPVKLCRHKRPARKRTATESSTETRDETGYVGETGPKGTSSDHVVVVDQNNNEMLKNGPTGHNNDVSGYVADDEMGSSNSGPRTEDEYKTVVYARSHFHDVMNDDDGGDVKKNQHVITVRDDIRTGLQHDVKNTQTQTQTQTEDSIQHVDISTHSTDNATGVRDNNENNVEDIVEPFELDVKAPGCRCFVDYRKLCGKCCRCTSKKSKLSSTTADGTEPRKRKLSDISCACIALHFRLALAWLKSKCTCTHNHTTDTLA